MSNIDRRYCPICGRVTQFYHVDSLFWECDVCGYEDYGEEFDDEEHEDDWFDGDF